MSALTQPHTFLCIDAHTCGNPVRVVAGGGPILPAVSMAEKRQIFLAEHDWVRHALMFEPRGHDVMSGSILYPPSRADCDLGVLFIEVSGCLPMCGHGTIGTVTVAFEEGLVTPKVEGRLALEVAGRPRRGRLRTQRPPCRRGAAVQHPELSPCRRGPRLGSRLRRTRGRRGLRRQLLRHRRAAEDLGRASTP